MLVVLRRTRGYVYFKCVNTAEVVLFMSNGLSWPSVKPENVSRKQNRSSKLAQLQLGGGLFDYIFLALFS